VPPPAVVSKVLAFRGLTCLRLQGTHNPVKWAMGWGERLGDLCKSRDMYLSPECFCCCFSFVLFMVPGLELRAYTLSHSTSPFL
jgi:hypothetical protein